MASYQSYIICTSPRSGSTLLCKLLSATEKSGKPDSHFHSPSISDWLGYYTISRDSYANERDLLAAIFDAAQDRGRGNTGLFGLRMQSDSFIFFMQQLNILCNKGTSRSEVDQIEDVFGKTLFIHLFRHNKLDQAISLVKATQTGLWHKAPDGTELERTGSPQSPFYDADAIARTLARLSKHEDQWNSWFTEQSLAPLRISYDALSTDPAGVLAEVLSKLGVDQMLAHNIELPVAKLADTTNTLWAEQFLSERGKPEHLDE